MQDNKIVTFAVLGAFVVDVVVSCVVSSINDFPDVNVSEGSDHSQSRNTKPSMGLSQRSVSYLVDLVGNFVLYTLI